MVAPAPLEPSPSKTTSLEDLETPPPAKALAIDWSKLSVQTEADALALWREIAPTGADWESKVEEIPEDHPAARLLGLALLHGGNVTCAPVPGPSCRAPSSLPAPGPDATFDDPCLRRELALWSLDAIDETDLPAVQDTLRALAALPPPESQLVSAAIDAYPMTEQDRRLELYAIARAAGHDDLINATGNLGDFDDAHLTAALVKHHIDGALDVLPAATHRAEFLAAIGDDKLRALTRTTAITELVAELPSGSLPREIRTALAAATKASDCRVAAAAARALVTHGERAFAPSRPRTKNPAKLMRALCVLASYEARQAADEPSYLAGYIPAKGLEQVDVTYDPYSDTDADGDGDPHTERTLTSVPRDQVVLPQVELMIQAFGSCQDTVCTAQDQEFRFGLVRGPGGDLLLGRLEIVERPPCR